MPRAVLDADTFDHKEVDLMIEAVYDSYFENEKFLAYELAHGSKEIETERCKGLFVKRRILDKVLKKLEAFKG